MRRVQQARRARDPRRHRRRPQRLRARRAQPGRFRRRAAAPLQRRRRRAAAQLPLGAADDHARPGARRRRRSPSIRRSPACASTPACRSSAARATTGAARSRAISPTRPALRPARRVPGGLRREGLGDRLRRPEELQRARPDRHVAGARRPDRRRLRDGGAPATPPSFELRSPPLAGGRARHQQAEQQRDGAAALPDARRDPARRRHARGGARGAAPVAARPRRQRRARRA